MAILLVSGGYGYWNKTIAIRGFISVFDPGPEETEIESMGLDISGGGGGDFAKEITHDEDVELDMVGEEGTEEVLVGEDDPHMISDRVEIVDTIGSRELSTEESINSVGDDTSAGDGYASYGEAGSDENDASESSESASSESDAGGSDDTSDSDDTSNSGNLTDEG